MNATAAKMIEAAKAHVAVASVTIWKDKRAYINLFACDKSFSGNRTHQFYINLDNAVLVDEKGKGRTSSAFDDATTAVAAALAVEVAA